MTIMLHCFIYLFFITFLIPLFVNSTPNPLDALTLNINIDDHPDKAKKVPFEESPLAEKLPVDSNEPTEVIDSSRSNDIEDSDKPKEDVDSDEPNTVEDAGKLNENVDSNEPREDVDSEKPKTHEILGGTKNQLVERLNKYKDIQKGNVIPQKPSRAIKKALVPRVGGKGPLCSDGEPTSCTCCDGKSMTDLKPGMCANCYQGPPKFCTCSDGKTVNEPCKMAKMEKTSWCYSKFKWKERIENSQGKINENK